MHRLSVCLSVFRSFLDRETMSHIEEEFDKIESEHGWKSLFLVSGRFPSRHRTVVSPFAETRQRSWRSNVGEEERHRSIEYQPWIEPISRCPAL